MNTLRLYSNKDGNTGSNQREKVIIEAEKSWHSSTRIKRQKIARARAKKNEQKLKLENEGVLKLKPIFRRHFNPETCPLRLRDKSQNSYPTRFRQ